MVPDALAGAAPAMAVDLLRQGVLRQDPGPDRVVQVVIDVGDAVGQAHDGGLPAVVRRAGGVVENAHPGLIAEVQPPPALFQPVHHPQTLRIVVEAAGHQFPQRPLPGVAEGGVPQVVPQADGLAQVLVQPQGPGDGPRQPRHLQGVGQPGAVVVPLRLQKHLGLVLEPPEGLGMGDAVHVPLKAAADRVRRFRAQPPPALGREGAVGADQRALQRLPLFAQTGHGQAPPSELEFGTLLYTT